MATQPSPLPDASGTTRGAVSLTTQTLGVGEKSADQLATPIVRLKHSVPPGVAAANEAQVGSTFGILMASESAAYDANFSPVRSYFPGYIAVEDTTTQLVTQGGVVSFLALSTGLLTGPLTLTLGAHGPVEFSTNGSDGIAVISIVASPGGFTVTIPNGASCHLRGGLDAVLKLYDSIVIAYNANTGAWVEVARNIL